jgi:hypothetical protein
LFGLVLSLVSCSSTVVDSSSGKGAGGSGAASSGGTSSQGGGGATGGGTIGGTGGTGAGTTATTTSTSTTTTTTITTTGPCVSAQECASFSDACNVGTCMNGACQAVPVSDGTPCDDGKSCTQSDTCNKGKCTGSLKPCAPSDACHVAVCDLASDACIEGPGNDGAACDDKDPCTTGSTCKLGACVGGQPQDCSALNGPCSVGVCDPQKGCVASPANEGAACDDGLFCTATDTCKAGKCVGAGDACANQPKKDCMFPICSEVLKNCQYVPAFEGNTCDDGNACTTNTTCSNGTCGGGAPVLTCTSGDKCCPAGCSAPQDLDCGCFTDWLVGTPCNGVDYGNGCSPSDTGYHYLGIFDGYACWWHQKNQAWNTTTASNYYHLAQHFNVTPGTGKCHWCDSKFNTPTPLLYSQNAYFDPNNVGAWGWCAEQDPNSGGFVCIPTEGHVACN